ncbi:MAG: fibronectin type III domain-containing protein [Victivallaceae bacterium]|nr:fibronectin type III domain-containing protein [Victivallaceae bacterium]
MATNNGSWELDDPIITVSYGDPIITIEHVDTWYNKETGEFQDYVVKYKTVFDSAEATFSWSGSSSFQGDPGISYVLMFSDRKDFSSKRTVVYSIGSDQHDLTLNQDASSPVSILASVGRNTSDNIYWCVAAGIWQDGVFISLDESEAMSFRFVDDSGTPIWSDAAPAKASVEVEVGRDENHGSVCDGTLTVTVETPLSGFGIAEYEVTLKNKTTGETSRFDIDYNSGMIQSTEDNNSFTLEIDLEEFFGENYDGNYTVSVKTSDGCGHSATSAAVNFIVDSVAPDKVENVKLRSSVSTVLITWSASHDGFGIRNYIIKKRASGTTNWEDILVVNGNETSAFEYGLPFGTYDFVVVAEDKNGNLSEDSTLQSITVSETEQTDDYADIYNFEAWDKFGTAKSFSAINTIGWGDLADYFCFVCDLSCTMTVDLSTLKPKFEDEDFGSKGIKIELYKYDGTGREKPIKSISVTSKDSEKTIISDLKLYGGTYFARVTANNVAAVDYYELDFEKKNFSATDYNTDLDNDWTKLEGHYDPIAAGESVRDWVGFGDAIDYRKLEVNANGSYSFVLTTAGDPVSLTIYQKISDTALKKLKTISTDGNSNVNATTMLFDIRNGEEYYISVSPSGDDSDYRVDFTCLHAYYDGNQKISNDDDDWQELDTTKFLTINMDNPSDQDWVGFSDTIDYRKIELEYAGHYNLRLSGISHRVIFTVYQQIGEDKLQKITSLTLSPQDGKTATGRISNLLFDSKDSGAVYYVSISAPDGNLEKNSDYSLLLTANKIFDRGRNLDDWLDLAVNGDLSSNYGDFGSVTAESIGQKLVRQDNITGEQGKADNWVGFGDAVDYVKFSLNCAAKLAFGLETNGNAALTVYSLQKGKSGYSLTQLGTAGEELWLRQGDYYIAVTSQDKDMNADIDYAVEVSSGKFFTKSNIGNTDDTWQKALENQSPLGISDSGRDQTDWVGFGNGADYWLLRFENDGWLKVVLDDEDTIDAYKNGEISFELRSSDQGKKLAPLAWDEENSCFISKEDFSTDNICYLGVICNDVKNYSVDYKVTFAVKTLQN